MAKGKKRTNGHGTRIYRPHGKVKKARQRVLNEARKRGAISNKRAKQVGGFGQAWYHLNMLCELGLLTHSGYSEWRPTRSRASL